MDKRINALIAHLAVPVTRSGPAYGEIASHIYRSTGRLWKTKTVRAAAQGRPIVNEPQFWRDVAATLNAKPLRMNAKNK